MRIPILILSVVAIVNPTFAQQHILETIAGSAIFTIGILSLFMHFGTRVPRDRILLWFGLFAGPYGLALLCRSVFIPGWSDRAELFIYVLGRSMGLLAGIALRKACSATGRPLLLSSSQIFPCGAVVYPYT